MKKKIKKIHKEKRMYVIIRGDLHPTYAMVQGGHALAEFALEHPETFKKWNNQYLIYLKVWNFHALSDLWNYFIVGKYPMNKWHKATKKTKDKWNKTLSLMSCFKEPDLDHQLTAIAIYDDGKKVKDLPLA